MVRRGLQGFLLQAAFLAGETRAPDAPLRGHAIGHAALAALGLDPRIALLDDKGLALHRFAHETLGLLAQCLLVHRSSPACRAERFRPKHLTGLGPAYQTISIGRATKSPLADAIGPNGQHAFAGLEPGLVARHGPVMAFPLQRDKTAAHLAIVNPAKLAPEDQPAERIVGLARWLPQGEIGLDAGLTDQRGRPGLFIGLGEGSRRREKR